jgi:outer membrane autotransporter protein
MKKKILVNAMMAVGCIAGTSAYAQFISPVAGDSINLFDQRLGLTTVGPLNTGRSVADRRSAVNLFDGTAASLNANTTATMGNLSGSLAGSHSGYLYRVLSGDLQITNNLEFGTGNSINTPNTTATPHNPLLLDLGDRHLDQTTGTLQTQGAVFVSTVNSAASSAGLLMNGIGALTVNQGTTGRISTEQLIELGGGQAGFKLILDLNSTLKNNTSFVFLQETRDQITGESSFNFSGDDAVQSNLDDTSYVIKSTAATVAEGGKQKVVVTFNRDNNVYITKSFTINHPSNDAALKLGTIAADGVALGDMQTALTRLDINDFGYGNNAANLAVQVKRLAPIANNSFLISANDALKLATGAIDYRIAARRGNWSGYSDANSSFWLKGVTAQTNSSGSVPMSTPTSQDTAGHDGFKTHANGIVMGFDKVFDQATYGLSYGNVSTSIRQADDRNGEMSKLNQHIWALYAQKTDGISFISGTLKYADGQIQGLRRTAIDRTADFDFGTHNTELTVKAGQRFDLANGRSAITPYVQATGGYYKQAEYEETGAGALSLRVSEQKIQRVSGELGLSMSHKGRFNGIKALTVFDVAVGKDLQISDQTVHARYTGETHTAHSNYTAFTTPAEKWASNYVNLQMHLQLEVAKGAMFKWGAAAELRQGRQKFGSDVSMNWVF